VHFATLDLSGLPYVGGASAVILSGGTMAVISATGTFSLATIGLTEGRHYFTAPDGGIGTEVIACFLAGTRIATPAGERAIESLRIGDVVLTQHSGPQRVKWIGRRGYSAAEAEANAPLRPILIAPGALGDGVPRRMLAVSPMHSLLIDGLFIPAAALVNGVSIRRGDADGPLDYLHLEFDAHEVVLRALVSVLIAPTRVSRSVGSSSDSAARCTPVSLSFASSSSRPVMSTNSWGPGRPAACACSRPAAPRGAEAARAAAPTARRAAARSAP
jgi:hypothetical protein